MNRRTRFATAMTLTFGLVAACGGGGDSASTGTPVDDDVVETSSPDTTPRTDPPATEPAVTNAPVTDPPTTDPPATSPPESDLPDWASGETVTVETDTGPLEMLMELAPFCESSRSFYIAANGVGFVREGQVATIQQLFAALDVLLPLAIATAPSDEFAVEPKAAQAQLAVIIPAFEGIGYDGSRTAELADPEPVFDALTGFTATRDSLRSFLVEACGADADVLDEQSRSAVAVAAEAAGEVIEPDEPVEAVDGSPIANAASTIELSVPADWTETEESVESGRNQLVASADIDAFSGLLTPGVLVLRGEGGFRDGGFVGRVLEFQADLEDIGCVLGDESDYDDGVYRGQERVFECDTDGLDIRLLGGTTADETLYAMVLLVSPSDEPGVRQLIVDTFQVS